MHALAADGVTVTHVRLYPHVNDFSANIVLSVRYICVSSSVAVGPRYNPRRLGV